MHHIGVILNELGATYDDVCKITTVYQGTCGATDIHKNLPIRSSYFKEPRASDNRRSIACSGVRIHGH